MAPQEKFKRVLVVDDDHVQVRLLEGRLSENGYTVMTAVEAADGLQKAIDERPDLIILDVMMPIINGYNFCKLLKSQEGHKHIPIILLTARDERKDVEIGMEVGANAYLTKPLNIEELFRTIRVLESMHKTEEQPSDEKK